jgi:hypothetical protein
MQLAMYVWRMCIVHHCCSCWLRLAYPAATVAAQPPHYLSTFTLILWFRKMWLLLCLLQVATIPLLLVWSPYVRSLPCHMMCLLALWLTAPWYNIVGGEPFDMPRLE